MNISDRFALPLLEAGQAQKEVTHNEALLAVDRLLHLAVASRTLATPPSAPVAGSAWIVPAAATGAWSGHTDAVGTWDGFGWSFRAPSAGMLAWVGDEGEFSVWHGGGWSPGGWPVTALRIGGRSVLGAAPATIAVPSGGSAVDAEARSAVAALIGALRAQNILA